MRGGGAGGGGGGGLGGGKNYDSVSNSDRDGYGQPDGKLIFFSLTTLLLNLNSLKPLHCKSKNLNV